MDNNSPVIGITWARGTGSTLEGKNKYPILGKPLIHYPLMSLKHSGAVQHHYVFTEDDDIAQATLDVGYKVIPRPRHLIRYRDKSFSMAEAWRAIVEHVAQDLDLPLPEAQGYEAFARLADVTFTLNCNNCMLRSRTFSKMLAMLRQGIARRVVPATPVDENLFLRMPDGALFPMWHMHGVNRQNYPPLFRVLDGTAFRDSSPLKVGHPNQASCEIDEIEAMDVHSIHDIEFLEFYLGSHPDHHLEPEPQK